MTRNHPASTVEVDESTAVIEPGSELDVADAEAEALDQETLEAFEVIRADQIRISWMQDRRAQD